MNEIQESVEVVYNSITQLGIDVGIPFHVPIESKADIVYLQSSLQWAIFIITLCVGMFNNLVRSCMGSVR